MMQAVGLKTKKIYAQGENKREVNRQLVQQYSGVKQGDTISFFYPEPLIFKKEDRSLFDLTIMIH